MASGDSVSLANGCVNSANGWVPVPVWAWERGRVDFSLERPETNSRDVLLGGETVQTRVQKWGNSLGVRIPRGLAEEVGLGAGTEVSLTAKDGELVLRPSVPSRLRLADLLASVTPANIHACIDTGDAGGAEAF